MESQAQKHWQNVYKSKRPNEVSWYQDYPQFSINLIKETGISRENAIIDIGSGSSNLPHALLESGYKNISVLDISEAGLKFSKEKLGQNAQKIQWIVADVLNYNFETKYHLWHDRAVFHFMTSPASKEKYKQAMNQALAENGYAIIASFALDGPERCSGLEVERYDSKNLQDELGTNFQLIKSLDEKHVTPWDSEQKFTYCLFKKN